MNEHQDESTSPGPVVPVAPDGLPAMALQRRDAVRAQLLRVAGGQESFVYAPGRRARWAIALAAAAAVTGVAASPLAAHRPVTDPSAIECRTSLDPDGLSAFVAFPDSVTSDGTHRARIKNAIAACSLPWSDGEFVLGGSSGPGPGWVPAVPPDPVPPLTTCVADDGHAVVIPSANPQDCLSMDLSILSP